MKRCFCIFVLITIICGIFNYSAFASSNEAPLDKARVLEKLEIYGKVDEETDFSREVTRGEFSNYLYNIINVKASVDDAKVYFVDVDKSSNCFLSVAMLYKMNVISKSESGYFYPDNIINYNEAYKMLVALSGYEDYALSNGGYPVGYLKAAMVYGLLDKSVNGGSINFADCTNILYKALTTKLEDTEITAGYNKNSTLLQIYKGINHYKGVINSYSEVSLTDKKIKESDKILVDDEEFVLDDDEKYIASSKYLGLKANVFYTVDDDINNVIYVDVSDNDEDVVISADDFVSYKDYAIKYRKNENGKTGEYILSKGTTFIYNGENKENEVSEVFKTFERGEITLRKTKDSDSDYNIAIINSYEDFVVGSYSGSTKTLVSKYNSGYSINLDDYKYVSVYDGNTLQQSISFSDEQVLNIAKYNNHLEIYKNNVSKTITVNQINNSGYYVEIDTDGGKFEIDNSCYEQIKNKLSVGISGTIKTDMFGRIAYFDIDSTSDYKIGYLINGKYEAKSFDSVGLLKVFTSTGEFQDIYFDKKVKIDGVKTEDVEAIFARMPGAEKTGGVYKVPMQLIRYKLNSNKKIIEIDTLNKVNEDESLKMVSDGSASKKIYCPSLECFNDTSNGQIMTKTTTPIFYVPGSETDYEDIKDKLSVYFSIKHVKDIYAANWLYIDGYAVGDEDYCCALITPESQGSSAGDSIIVTKKGLGINAEGNSSTMICGYNFTGTYNQFVLDENIVLKGFNSFDEIDSGDVIAVSAKEINGVKIIISAELVYDYSVLGTEKNWRGYKSYKAWFEDVVDQNKVSIEFGYVAAKNGTLIRFGNIPGQVNERYNTSCGKILVYDGSKDKNNVYEGTVADILDYEGFGENCSRILIRRDQITAIGMLIYK